MDPTEDSNQTEAKIKQNDQTINAYWPQEIGHLILSNLVLTPDETSLTNTTTEYESQVSQFHRQINNRNGI